MYVLTVQCNSGLVFSEIGLENFCIPSKFDIYEWNLKHTRNR